MIIETAEKLGLNVYGPSKQNEFLKKLGIDLRCQQLIKFNPSKKQQIKEAYNKWKIQILMTYHQILL